VNIIFDVKNSFDRFDREERQMGTRWYSHRFLAVIFVAFSLLLATGLAGTAAAITFSQPIPTFDFDVGIDYSALTGRLVTSVNFNNQGNPVNLEDVNPFTGTRANINGFAGRVEELKVATARAVTGAGCPQNAPVGTIFASNGDSDTTQAVNMISPAGGANPSGAVIASVALPGETASLRGGFYFDFRCVITTARGTPNSNYLVVVSGDESPSATVGGRVWLIPINAGPTFGTPILLQSIIKPNPFGAGTIPAHLEGVIVVPVDTKYGPWSGQIVTGDEDRRATGPIINGDSPKIYAINPVSGACQSSSNGSFVSPTCSTQFNITGPVPHPEDFDFIEGDFYGVAFNNSVTSSPVQGHILKASLLDFPAANGDILITQEYPQTPGDSTPIPVTTCNDVGPNSGLYQIRWDGTNNQFVSTQLTRTGTTPTLCQWEHVTFVPVAGLQVVKSPDGSSFNQGSQVSFTIVVSNPGPGTASNVVLTDQLPSNGGLVWQTATPSKGSCTIGAGGDPANFLRCNLGNIQPGAANAVTVTVTSTATTPAAACTSQPNPAANATADGGLKATDSGSLTCTPPPTNLQTVTQGGWGAPAHGQNPGTILNAYFTNHPGTQFVIGSNAGGCFKDTFTSAAAIRAFLPQGGTPSALTASATNPTAKTNVFAGQVLALQLNVTILGGGLGSFVLPSGPAAGKTVAQVLADANAALGCGTLPSYVSSISDLNDIVDAINNMFDKG
jgi:uncharacterized repeat protein (TIGR01451 family)